MLDRLNSGEKIHINNLTISDPEKVASREVLLPRANLELGIKVLNEKAKVISTQSFEYFTLAANLRFLAPEENFTFLYPPTSVTSNLNRDLTRVLAVHNYDTLCNSLLLASRILQTHSQMLPKDILTKNNKESIVDNTLPVAISLPEIRFINPNYKYTKTDVSDKNYLDYIRSHIHESVNSASQMALFSAGQRLLNPSEIEYYTIKDSEWNVLTKQLKDFGDSFIDDDTWSTKDMIEYLTLAKNLKILSAESIEVVNSKLKFSFPAPKFNSITKLPERRQF